MTGRHPNGTALCGTGLDLSALEVVDLLGLPLGGPDLEGPASDGLGQVAFSFGHTLFLHGSAGHTCLATVSPSLTNTLFTYTTISRSRLKENHKNN